MKSEKQIKKLLESGWVEEGEKVRSALGGEGERGHMGATIGGRLLVPYWPSPPTREPDVESAPFPYPTALVREGRFHGDEWVHDPAIWAWITAGATDQLAVQCADALVAAGASGWFVITDRRLAVVVEAAAAEGSDDVTDAEDNSEGDRARGFGRFLGKARSAVAAVSEFSENLKSGTDITTLWQCSKDQVTAGRLDPKGRSSHGDYFSWKRFVDGSLIEIRAGYRM